MNDLLHSDDDRMFDRLVDGELSADERRELLQSLDTAPAGWRRCAIAFLEAQSWGEGLQIVVREPSPRLVADTPPSTAQISKEHVAGRPRQHAMAWLAIAAGLLVAVSLAVTQRNPGPAVNDTAQSDSLTTPNIAPSVSSPKGARDNDALTFWVRDETGKSHPLRVPLLDADPMDRELGMSFQSGVPDDLRAHLRGRGYDVQSRRRYAPLMMENGRRMIVPVEDTKIVPVSQNVY